MAKYSSYVLCRGEARRSMKLWQALTEKLPGVDRFEPLRCAEREQQDVLLVAARPKLLHRGL